MMKRSELQIQLEMILDDWDPLGVLHMVSVIKSSNPSRYTSGEYSKYVRSIVTKYLEGESICQYLIDLQAELWTEPNDEMTEAIQITSDKILKILSQYSSDDLIDFVTSR